jgi:CDP-glucose 4,6-dehydratase
MFTDFFSGKKILITGHTGFKGSWLTTWLLKLNAQIIGISIDIPTKPSMFEELDLEKKIKHYLADIREIDKIKEIVFNEEPDIIFHLAAQAIVSSSHENPTEAFSTNVIGTMNILEIMRNFKKECQVVLITSDKCYDNVEWIWGYKENDMLGGKDIYSGSKGAAELVIKSYFNSFFNNEHPVKLAIGRAGNVIGGGDWAKDRIVADTMIAWSQNNFVNIRSPFSTRPWQHVLEPLSGYLLLAYNLALGKINGEAFNFGPKSEQNKTVEELLKDLSQYWGFNHNQEFYRITNPLTFHEASLLKLNCDKALFYLKWESTLTYLENVELVSSWYFNYYIKKTNMFKHTMEQIIFYEKLLKQRNAIWKD